MMVIFLVYKRGTWQKQPVFSHKIKANSQHQNKGSTCRESKILSIADESHIRLRVSPVGEKAMGLGLRFLSLERKFISEDKLRVLNLF